MANCLIFYNVFAISRILHERMQQGQPVSEEILARLSPYLTQHINRFGKYQLDLSKAPPALDYTLAIYNKEQKVAQAGLTVSL